MARGRRTDYEWSKVGETSLTSIGVAATNIGGNVEVNIPTTLMRARGEMLVQIAQTPSAGDVMEIAIALGVFSTDAVAAGAGSVPDPIDEPEYPWVWWRGLFLAAPDATLSRDLGSQVVRLGVDSKAMRRMKPGESLAYVIQNKRTSGSPVIDVHIAATRVLFGT